MTMRYFGLALAVTAFSCAAAIAAPPQERVRGTITSVSAGEIVVHTRGGRDVTVLTNGKTSYLEVAKSNLDHIDHGSYIGTATKSVGSTLVALEVVIFPASMRGTSAEVKKGAAVFIHGVENNGTVTAQAVAVGIDGVTPPM